MAKDYILGLTVDRILENGQIIACMDLEFIHEKMEENMKAIIVLIKNTEEEYIYGMMAKNISENGKMEGSMVKVN